MPLLPKGKQGKRMKRVIKQFHYGEAGFTLIELLAVVAILGVLATIPVLNAGKFTGKAKSETYAAELHNIQTVVTAVLADSESGQLDSAVSTTADMDGVTADNGDLTLSNYLTGLDADGTVKSGCTYAFTEDGTVTQTTP